MPRTRCSRNGRGRLGRLRRCRSCSTPATARRRARQPLTRPPSSEYSRTSRPKTTRLASARALIAASASWRRPSVSSPRCRADARTAVGRNERSFAISSRPSPEVRAFLAHRGLAERALLRHVAKRVGIPVLGFQACRDFATACHPRPTRIATPRYHVPEIVVSDPELESARIADLVRASAGPRSAAPREVRVATHWAHPSDHCLDVAHRDRVTEGRAMLYGGSVSAGTTADSFLRGVLSGPIVGSGSG